MALCALPRILYCIFTHVRRPLRPGASFGAVCPPAFTVPGDDRIVGAIVPAKDDLYQLHVSAFDSEPHLFDVFLKRPPSVLISALGSVDNRLLAHDKPVVGSSGAVPAPQKDGERGDNVKHWQ